MHWSIEGPWLDGHAPCSQSERQHKQTNKQQPSIHYSIHPSISPTHPLHGLALVDVLQGLARTSDGAGPQALGDIQPVLELSRWDHVVGRGALVLSSINRCGVESIRSGDRFSPESPCGRSNQSPSPHTMIPSRTVSSSASAAMAAAAAAAAGAFPPRAALAIDAAACAVCVV